TDRLLDGGRLVVGRHDDQNPSQVIARAIVQVCARRLGRHQATGTGLGEAAVVNASSLGLARPRRQPHTAAPRPRAVSNHSGHAPNWVATVDACDSGTSVTIVPRV